MPLEHLYRQRVLFWKYPNCCLMQITWLITKVDACAMKGIFKCTTKLSNLAKARSPAACISTVSCVAQMFGPSMRSIGRWGGSLGTDKAEGRGGATKPECTCSLDEQVSTSQASAFYQKSLRDRSRVAFKAKMLCLELLGDESQRVKSHSWNLDFHQVTTDWPISGSASHLRSRLAPNSNIPPTSLQEIFRFTWKIRFPFLARRHTKRPGNNRQVHLFDFIDRISYIRFSFYYL